MFLLVNSVETRLLSVDMVAALARISILVAAKTLRLRIILVDVKLHGLLLLTVEIDVIKFYRVIGMDVFANCKQVHLHHHLDMVVSRHDDGQRVKRTCNLTAEVVEDEGAVERLLHFLFLDFEGDVCHHEVFGALLDGLFEVFLALLVAAAAYPNQHTYKSKKYQRRKRNHKRMLPKRPLNGDAQRTHFRFHTVGVAALNHKNIIAVVEVGEHSLMPCAYVNPTSRLAICLEHIRIFAARLASVIEGGKLYDYRLAALAVEHNAVGGFGSLVAEDGIELTLVAHVVVIFEHQPRDGRHRQERVDAYLRRIEIRKTVGRAKIHRAVLVLEG